MQSLSGSALKIIAVATMTMDHCASVMLPAGSLPYIILRAAGRLSFPLFAFLTAEGTARTSSFARYALSLAVLALVSEIPFDLAFSRRFRDPEHRNVIFTLLIGSGLCKATQMDGKNGFPLFVLLAGLALLLNADYGLWGSGTVLLFFLLRDQGRALRAGACALLSKTPWQIPGFLLTAAYNGQRGFIKGKAKYLFYLYYPAHLLAIHLINNH